MIFEELDSKMRRIEKAQDNLIPKNCFLCARLDGRGFSRFTEDNFEKPYDFRFYRYMTETLTHLMSCGFNILIGYTQSDEISLLFHPADDTYNHKIRKLLSVLAGEASGFFSIRSGTPVSFDCRLIPLPDEQSVKDYFAWRQEDLHRNSLDSYCYYAMIKDGMSRTDAAEILSGKKPDYKIKLLSEEYGIKYDSLPDWQKSGCIIYHKTETYNGTNKKTGEPVIYTRRELERNEQLPTGEAFGNYILSFLKEN